VLFTSLTYKYLIKQPEPEIKRLIPYKPLKIKKQVFDLVFLRSNYLTATH